MNAVHDENGRPTAICVSNLDGQTIIPLEADETSHALKIYDGVGGSDNGNNGGNARIDENGVSVFTALSSAGDGSIIEVYAENITSGLLITN
jgi:hypothetical protein